MMIPELIQPAMHHFHTQGYHSCFLRRLLEDPFQDVEVPNRSSNGNIVHIHLSNHYNTMRNVSLLCKYATVVPLIMQ